MFFNACGEGFIGGCVKMSLTEKNRREAAKCVAMIFQGRGDEIIKKSDRGAGYGEEGRKSLTDDEKELMKDMFEFFLALIEGKGVKLDVPKAEMRTDYQDTEEE